MEIFNIIAGICSILSLILSFIAIKKVFSIQARIGIDNSMQDTKISVNGNGNKTAGRDLNV